MRKLCRYREIYREVPRSTPNIIIIGITPSVRQCRIQSYFESGILVWDLKLKPQTLKSVDFWCKLSSTLLFAELREGCFELFRMQNSQKFPGFCPWTPLGRAYSAAPDSRLHDGFSPRYARRKTGTSEKLLDTALYVHKIFQKN